MLFCWFSLILSCKPLGYIITTLLLTMYLSTELSNTSTHNEVLSAAAGGNDASNGTLLERGIDESGGGSGGEMTGKYYYNSSSNFDNYLKALGVPYLLRTFAGIATPIVTIQKHKCEKQSDSIVGQQELLLSPPNIAVVSIIKELVV